MTIRYLELEELLRLHFQVIVDFGGSHGVRDEGRLKSVVEAPKQYVFAKQQYETVYEKAAVHLWNIVGDHPFIDGNNRTALLSCGIFLSRNGIEIIAAPKDLEDFTVTVATKHLDTSEISAWLKSHTCKQ